MTRFIALPPLRCDWCGDQYVPTLDIASRCPVCAQHGIVAAQRRREQNNENWRRWWEAQGDEAPDGCVIALGSTPPQADPTTTTRSTP